LALTLAVFSAASSLRVHPYYTSYFNTLSGGPENGCDSPELADTGEM
jgi:hypothetical protein